MPKYLFAYHGGSMKETEEEQAATMAAWGAWMGQHEASFADGGAPTIMNMTVTADGMSEGGGPNPLTGYSVIESDSPEAACVIAEGCPIIADGGSVEIAQIHEM